ncbi:MAG: hypothetical protein F4138_01050 [Acidimicrobiia bacterium]|nr:hypothetical protein [Acidimicrobiia bacterium]
MNGDLQLKLPALPESGRMVELAITHAANHLDFPETTTTKLQQAIKEAMLLMLGPVEPDACLSENSVSEHHLEISLLSKADILTFEAQLTMQNTTSISKAQIDRFKRTIKPLVNSGKVNTDNHRLWLQVTARGHNNSPQQKLAPPN